MGRLDPEVRNMGYFVKKCGAAEQFEKEEKSYENV